MCGRGECLSSKTTIYCPKNQPPKTHFPKSNDAKDEVCHKNLLLTTINAFLLVCLSLVTSTAAEGGRI